MVPDPECFYGYTNEQVSGIMGDRLPEFNAWMEGQTRMLCQGPADKLDCPDDDPRRDMYENRGYPRCSVAHGPVTYLWDVDRFLDVNHTGHDVWD